MVSVHIRRPCCFRWGLEVGDVTASEGGEERTCDPEDVASVSGDADVV